MPPVHVSEYNILMYSIPSDLKNRRAGFESLQGGSLLVKAK
jgi:hypothetical protein